MKIFLFNNELEGFLLILKRNEIKAKVTDTVILEGIITHAVEF